MTTTIKIEKLLPVFSALQQLAAVKMPVKAGYRIAKNLGLLRTELEAYETARVKLATELSGGKMKENSNEFDLSEAAMKEFNTRHTELLAEEVAIGFVTLAPEDLGSVEIEPWILNSLDGLVIVEAQPVSA